MCSRQVANLYKWIHSGLNSASITSCARSKQAQLHSDCLLGQMAWILKLALHEALDVSQETLNMISDEQCSQPKFKRVESVLKKLTQLYLLEPAQSQFNKCRYMLSKSSQYSFDTYITARAVISVSLEIGLEWFKYVLEKIKMRVKVNKQTVVLLFNEENQLKAVWQPLKQYGLEWVRKAKSITLSRQAFIALLPMILRSLKENVVQSIDSIQSLYRRTLKRIREKETELRVRHMASPQQLQAKLDTIDE